MVMPDFKKLAVAAILADSKIDEREVRVLQRELKDEGGKYSNDAARFLIELRTTAHKKKKEVTPAFENFFFKVVTEFVLKDGHISQSEVDWIRANLLADGKIDDNEWDFVQKIHKKAKSKNASWEALYNELAAKRAKAKK
jgi:uncharacterized tellurite resistance protein B-like protein